MDYLKKLNFFSFWFKNKILEYQKEKTKLNFLGEIRLRLPDLNLISEILKEKSETQLEEFSITIGEWIQEDKLNNFLSSLDNLEKIRFLLLDLKVTYEQTHFLLSNLISKKQYLENCYLSFDNINPRNISIYGRAFLDSKNLSIKNLILRSYGIETAGSVEAFISSYGENNIRQLDLISFVFKKLNNADFLSLEQMIRNLDKNLRIDLYLEEVEDEASLSNLINICNDKSEYIDLSLSYKGMEVFSSYNDASSEITNELFESFTEIIESEIDSIFEINDENEKKLLIDALFDKTNEFNDLKLLTNYIRMFSPANSPRFILLYCFFEPKRWNHLLAEKYEESMINSYIKLINPDSSTLADEMKNHAKKIILKKLIAHKIFSAPSLDENLLRNKNNFLNYLKDEISEKHNDDSSMINIDIESLEEEKFIAKNVTFKFEIQENKDLLKKSITGSILDEKHFMLHLFKAYLMTKEKNSEKTLNFINVKPSKILDIVKAISYQEKHKCDWQDLPQSFPPFKMVQFCSYIWKKNGVLQEILHLIDFEKNSSIDYSSDFPRKNFFSRNLPADCDQFYSSSSSSYYG